MSEREQQVQEMGSRAYESDTPFQLTAESSALPVIDIQNEFVRPEWTPSWALAATRQIPGVKQLIGPNTTKPAVVCLKIGCTMVAVPVPRRSPQ